MASALIRFGWETGSEIVAEGMETEAELNTVRTLGVGKAQGYHLGRPMPLRETLTMLARTPAAGRLVA